jgi:NAD(P)-dependent dehydrogenase (short-subunit alcohol dehydrogenase family)
VQIKDQVFIVTGGASGLGGATTRMLAAHGGKVVIADVQTELGTKLAAELGTNAKFIKCDVTSESDGQAVVDGAIAMGSLRGLINCAGIGIGIKTTGKDGAHPLDKFARVININLIGTFNMIRLFATAAVKNSALTDNERGVIINTASVAAFDGQIGQAAYSASKGGVVGMTLPIARDLARDGIRNVTIAPGLFETPMMAGLPDDLRDSLGKQVPFPSRLGKPAEYADLVAAIITNPMINGETIRLDGAIRMAPR